MEKTFKKTQIAASAMSAFMREHDLLWDRPPVRWQEGPFIGNGLVGALLYFDLRNQRLKWWLSRTDVGRLDYPGRGKDSIRIQIGSLMQVFAPGTVITGCRLRLDIRNAEIRGTIHTSQGNLNLRALAPVDSSAIIVDVSAAARGPRWQWQPDLKPAGKLRRNARCAVFTADDYRPHPRTKAASGGFAVAWRSTATAAGKSRLVCAIGASPVTRRIWNRRDNGAPARTEAVKELQRLRKTPAARLTRAHRQWWHAFYRRGFLSFTPRELESFYWIQLYKFGSTARPDRPMVDNHGVWSPWATYGFATWDFNVQSTYRLHLTANMQDFGQPLLDFLERNFNRRTMWDCACGELRAGMRQQTFLRYRFFDRQFWEHGPDLPCDGPAKFLWGVHNYWMHYRHRPQPAMLPRMLLMLEAGINAMRAGMRREADGRYHIPRGRSWEAWYGRDPTGLLAVLKWALITALEYAEAAGVTAARQRRWRDLLENLAPYPRNKRGYLLGAGQPPVHHRHWTHLMMLFPLDIHAPGTHALLEKSVDTWALMSAGLDGRRPDAGFACPAAMALYAWLHAGAGRTGTDRIPALADVFMYGDTDRGPGIWPSTMYSEYTGQVIETPMFMAAALQECLLQSRRDGVHVFPAVPDAWPDARFADWHAFGDCLVSAARRQGRTAWISVTSRSGLPLRLHTGMHLPEAWWNGVRLTAPAAHYGPETDTIAELRLPPGATLVISATKRPDMRIGPVAARRGAVNAFGLNRRFLKRRPGFETRVRALAARIRQDDTIPADVDPLAP